MGKDNQRKASRAKRKMLKKNIQKRDHPSLVDSPKKRNTPKNTPKSKKLMKRIKRRQEHIIRDQENKISRQMADSLANDLEDLIVMLPQNVLVPDGPQSVIQSTEKTSVNVKNASSSG